MATMAAKTVSTFFYMLNHYEDSEYNADLLLTQRKQVQGDFADVIRKIASVHNTFMT